MDIREFTHSGPLFLQQPQGDGEYTACLVHTGKNFDVRFIRPEDAPAFINPKTREVCHWMLAMIWGKDYSKTLAHEKMKLRFDDRLVSASGETRHKEWKWSDWVPFCP